VEAAIGSLRLIVCVSFVTAHQSPWSWRGDD
jgi:hypothetical protein